MQKKPEQKPAKKLTLTRETIKTLNQGTEGKPVPITSPCRVCLTTI